MAVITSPVSGKTVSAANVGNIMGLLYEDLATLITGADIRFDFEEMERSYGEWGAMITEGRIPASDSESVNKATTALCPTSYKNLVSRYYDTWTEKVYPAEVRRVELTKILRGEVEYADFLAMIAKSNVEGFRNEVNKGINNTLANSAGSAGTSLFKLATGLVTHGDYASVITGGVLKETSRYELLERPSFDDYYAEILTHALRMTRANSVYTEGNEEYGANMEDLVIYMPIEIFAHANVAYLQHLFNLAGINKLPQIKLHDAAHAEMEDELAENSESLYATFILDKRVINHVTRYMASDVDDIDCRKSTRISLHVEDMIKYAPFYKAYGIVSHMPTK